MLKISSKSLHWTFQIHSTGPPIFDVEIPDTKFIAAQRIITPSHTYTLFSMSPHHVLVTAFAIKLPYIAPCRPLIVIFANTS